ncbi:hypothetical protein GCM10020331_098440 [Ectobacillus funiculus]
MSLLYEKPKKTLQISLFLTVRGQQVLVSLSKKTKRRIKKYGGVKFYMAKKISLIMSRLLKMTMVGFGQAGTRMVDTFAAIKKVDGSSVYNCLALNSNDGDLTELRYIPKKQSSFFKPWGAWKKIRLRLQECWKKTKLQKKKIKNPLLQNVYVQTMN